VDTTFQRKLEDTLLEEIFNLREKIDALEDNSGIAGAIFKAQILSYNRIIKGLNKIEVQ